MNTRIPVFLAVALLAIIGISASQRRPAKPTGMFTDMRFIEDSGDLLGTEVFIVSGRDGYRAVVQVAEGVPADPVVVPVEIKEGRCGSSIATGMSLASSRALSRPTR